MYLSGCRDTCNGLDLPTKDLGQDYRQQTSRLNAVIMPVFRRVLRKQPTNTEDPKVRQ